MAIFSKIRINHYKRIVSADLQLRDLNVLIGANGVGKTSLLESFQLLASAAQGGLQEKINAKGGLESLQTFDSKDDLGFSVEMPSAGHAPLSYEIEFRKSGLGYLIQRETLSQKRPNFDNPFLYINSSGADVRYYDSGKLLRPTWEHNPLEASLSQVPKMYREAEEFRKRLASLAYYGLIVTDSNAPIRQPQQMRPASNPGKTGEDLISSLYFLRESNRERFEVLEDTLSAAFPSFERLDFPPVAAGILTLTWKDRNFRHPIYLHQLSEGTIRFLWLAAILLTEETPSVTLLDEPEVSMHPELLRLLVDLFRGAAKRTQLIVATHSERLVRFLEPKEVLVLDYDDSGATQFQWADSDQLDLEKWLADYSLDQLWQMGRLGGKA